MADADHLGLTADNLFTFFRELWDRSPDPFWICERKSSGWMILAANPASQAVDPRQKWGAYVEELLADFPDSKTLMEGYVRLDRAKNTVFFEQRPVIDGDPRLFETMLVPILDEAGHVTHVWGTSRDRTQYLKAYNELQTLNRHMDELIQEKTRELEIANEKLAALSLTDPLTGIANRRCLDNYLTDEVSKLARHHRYIALILLDIDHFKRYNDSMGHLAGDEALRRVAVVLQKCANRKSDLVARYGGEEFAIVLPECTLEEAKIMANRVVARIVQASIPHPDSPTAMHMTVSAGVVLAPAASIDSPDELIKEADQALYKSKADGRNRFTLKELV
jgi:diguanylate cyclase (GGDEF)-like protein